MFSKVSAVVGSLIRSDASVGGTEMVSWRGFGLLASIIFSSRRVMARSRETRRCITSLRGPGCVAVGSCETAGILSPFPLVEPEPELPGSVQMLSLSM